ncbi:MAG: glycerol-3-phosphate dehydrogenase, partial [Pseudomonadales bacterium]|nr:glycerol-3-phosphate dehydrogenase [Pseudomonadales bacterium]
LGGVLKNIYAVASGIAAALGMGDNTKSMLITRSLAEMSRFAARLGANPMTFLGLAGVGDLFVTCTSPLSRNYQVGYNLAKGKKLEDILENLGGTAEGVNTIALVKQKSVELEVYMPLVHGLHEILFEDKALMDVIKHLMLGEQNTDVEFVLPGPDKLANLKKA